MEKYINNAEVVPSKKSTKTPEELESLERFGSSNPYIVLGVSEVSSVKEIVSAYRKLILQYHPDKSKDPRAKEISQYLNRAISKLVTKEGTLLPYNPERDIDEDLYQSYEDDIPGFNNVSDEEWYAGDRFWEILAEAEKGRYTDESLHNQKEAKEEREFIMDMFADPRNELHPEMLVMTRWDDNGRLIDKKGNVTGDRDFTKVGYSIQSLDKQTAIRHKKRIYNSKGEIVFDGSNPKAYKTNDYGDVILPSDKESNKKGISKRAGR